MFTKEQYEFRAAFSSFCVNHQYYFSLLLFGQASVTFIDKLPALAGVSCINGNIDIILRNDIINLWQKSQKAAYFVLMHEIRHIIQCADFRYCVDSIDVSPVLTELNVLKNKAKTKKMKDYWQNLINTWSQIEKIRDNKNLRSIINQAMDAALHEDLRKLIPGAFEIVSEYILSIREDHHKDKIVPQNKKQKKILEAAEDKFPNDKKEMVKEYKRNCGVLYTKESLSIFWDVDGVFSPVLPENGDWVLYADEGVKYLAKKLAEHPANSPLPEEGESDMDGHDFDYSERNSCEVKGKIEAAQNEAKKWAHKAGKQLGDLAFESKYVELNKKLNKTLNSLNIRMTHILKESNNQEYTYSAINRLYSDIDYLPGHKKTLKASPSVVLVLDTSGSMWDNKTLNQLAAAARMYYNKGMLAKFYCCDVNLIEINIKNPNLIKLEGGGGTVFDNDLAMKIVSDLKAKKKVDIVYITDEAVDGLETTKNNKKYKVHVINIHNF